MTIEGMTDTRSEAEMQSMTCVELEDKDVEYRKRQNHDLPRLDRLRICKHDHQDGRNQIPCEGRETICKGCKGK